MLKDLINSLKDIPYSKDEKDLQFYGSDWTRFYIPKPLLVVFPNSSKEIEIIVNLALELGFSIVPSGGRTGLSGGAVAANNEVVLSLKNMNKLVSFNENSKSITVQAGMVTEDLQKIAKEKGLYFPIDLAAKGSCTIGGNVATNAGGIHVIRYGTTRDSVLGLQVVTGKGELLSLNNGLVKNATGPSLMHLFVGSEGTLGVITEVTLKLVSPPKRTITALFGLNDFANTHAIITEAKKKFLIHAVEFFDNNCLEKVLSHHQKTSLLSREYEYYLLVEMEISQDEMAGFVEKLYVENLILDDVIGEDKSNSHKIWFFRESITSSIQEFTPYKNDISVSVEKLEFFIKETRRIIKTNFPALHLLLFGHLGDGNVHVNLLKPERMSISDFENTCIDFSHQLYALLKDLNGSVSAEHGIGLLKKEFLHYTLSEEEISYLWGVKKVFDPSNIMNPGKVLPIV